MDKMLHIHHQRPAAYPPTATPPLDAAAFREECLAAGADDAGFVSIDRPEIDDQREEILAAFPRARTLVSFVVRMNPDAIRTPARSIANHEFHAAGEDVTEVGRRIVDRLAAAGHRALTPPMGFPMEMDRYPQRIWVVSHKPVAVAAGLGRMGIHRNVIHPRFGNFVLLGTVITDAEFTNEGRPLDFEPCLECKLCVAACPVGAIGRNGEFDFSACYTHNYREFMGGFTDFVESIAESGGRVEYRRRVSDAESVSWWQSLSYGANYKAAYCMAVCPAGDDVVAPFHSDRKAFLGEIVRPLQDKPEPVYVVAESDAAEHVARRFPRKSIREVRNPLRPASIEDLLAGMPLTFQRGRSRGVSARYHFTFTGKEPLLASVDIRDQRIAVERGHAGAADVRVTADSATWLAWLRGERALLPALLTGRIRIRGPLRLMRAFGRCFPR